MFLINISLDSSTCSISLTINCVLQLDLETEPGGKKPLLGAARQLGLLAPYRTIPGWQEIAGSRAI